MHVHIGYVYNAEAMGTCVCINIVLSLCEVTVEFTWFVLISSTGCGRVRLFYDIIIVDFTAIFTVSCGRV